MFLNSHKKTTIVFFFSLILVFVTGCQKEITVDLPAPNDKLVVQGHIEQDEYAYVYLSKNAPYFEAADLVTIQKYLVKGAIITVSDGTSTDTLKEVIPGYGYFYKGTRIKGEIGKSYTLTIIADGKTLTAVTRIPNPVNLDSLWFKARALNDSMGFIWAHLKEPMGLGNCYRLLSKRLNNEVDEDFHAPPASVFNDKFIDGKSFDFVLSRGYKPTTNAEEFKNSERLYFKTGDIVVLKFCAIEQSGYEFYKSYEAEVANKGNPFANPVNIKTNLIPAENALGVWCGYGVSLDTLLLIPR